MMWIWTNSDMVELMKSQSWISLTHLEKEVSYYKDIFVSSNHGCIERSYDIHCHATNG